MEARQSGKSGAGFRVPFFGIIWTAFNLSFLCTGLWMTWGALEAWRWTSVPCVVERFEITADQTQDPPFRPDLVYRYELDGRKYTGTRLWTGKEGSDHHEDLAEVRERFLTDLSKGAAKCRVKPDEPETSALLPSGSSQIRNGLIFTAVGGSFVLIGFGLIFQRSDKRITTVAEGGTPNHSFVPAIAFLFFACVGLVMLGSVISKYVDYFTIRGWKQVEAEVIWSRIRIKRESRHLSHLVDIFYSYQVDGREYHSNRYDVMGNSSSREEKRELVRSHPEGSKFKVFFDPSEPWRAVVDRSLGWSGLIVLFPLPFLALGVGGLWAMHKLRRGWEINLRDRKVL